MAKYGYPTAFGLANNLRLKREKAKKKALVLKKLRRERDDNRFMGRLKRGR